MIDYEPAKQRYVPTPEDRAWLLRRIGYYGCHLLLVLLLGYFVGPNLILFRSVFSPTRADYVKVTTGFVPMIAAIKAYQRDFGKLPSSSDLPPEYMPANSDFTFGEILNTTSITFPAEKHSVVEYEFSAAKEGWIIHSPRYDGRIPAPIVLAAPKPAPSPATNPTRKSADGN